jgi:hypothetical protein
LTGPEGQFLNTELLEEVSQGDSQLCMVRVFYEGQTEEAILYFDTFNFEQPRSPVGFACGSSTEYIRLLANARYSGF